MKFFEYREQLERIETLAKKNATGTPKELADRINVSERTIFRIIQNMKDFGIPIEYCRKTNSYSIKK